MLIFKNKLPSEFLKVMMNSLLNEVSAQSPDTHEAVLGKRHGAELGPGTLAPGPPSSSLYSHFLKPNK